ncbi:MAG TPA: ABC transporter ATP-binding protein [Desulfopila sp.]|nr:ABC transporter ATP-binding protein [Desulfopila sp.]
MSQSPLFTLGNGIFKYGNTSVFDDLSFSLRAGRFYGLIGPNGSGKSTLIDLLMGIKELSGGHLRYKGRTLNSYRKKDLARHLALVPQQITVGFDYSVYDLVLMGRHPYIPRFSAPTADDVQRVDEALELMDIFHLRKRSVGTLSGGEKQRVIVARALAQATETIMLDEATSSLDIKHTIEIMRVLQRRVKESGVTVLAAIHDLNLAAAFCEELLVLNKGRLYTMGKTGDILSAALLLEVFSVQGTVLKDRAYPRIEYQMHGGEYI